MRSLRTGSALIPCDIESNRSNQIIQINLLLFNSEQNGYRAQHLDSLDAQLLKSLMWLL